MKKLLLTSLLSKESQVVILPVALRIINSFETRVDPNAANSIGSNV